jgi:hypothetical protein
MYDTQTVSQAAAKHRSHWFLWWKVDPAEIQQQVGEYHADRWTLARHVAAYCLLVSVAITTIFINVGLMDSGAYFDAGIMLFLAACIFLGQRWAMIAAMLFWTFEKVVGFTDFTQAHPPGGAFVISQLIWWATYMHAFWVAFRVEQERRKIGLKIS